MAIGSVSSTGAVLKQANTVNGNVSASKPGAGHYTVNVVATGAFAGDAGSDFAVEVGIISGALTDRIAVASVSNVSDNQLTVVVRTTDVEDDSNPSAGVARDATFYFLIRRLPNGSSVIPAGSRFLHATGQVTSIGNLVAGYGIDGAQITTSQGGVSGDYDISIEKTGAYADDSDNEYIVFITAQEVTTQDNVFGSVADTSSDDQVTINIRSADSQSAVASDNASSGGTDFYFSIYRISDESISGPPKSKMLLSTGRVRGNNGAVSNGGTSLPAGATITGSRLADGLYRITIVSPGAFVGRTTNEFTTLLTISSSSAEDKVIRGNVDLRSDDEIRIAVSTNDVEEDGQEFGVRTDSDFFFSLFDTVAQYRPDMRIGLKKRAASMKGDDKINSRGAGQSIKVKVRSRGKTKFYFAAQNDGNSVDHVRLRQVGLKRSVKLKHFRLTGGRRNVTGAVKSGRIAASDVRPGGITKFESQIKYKKPTDTPRLKILLKGASENGNGVLDAVRANTVYSKK